MTFGLGTDRSAHHKRLTEENQVLHMSTVDISGYHLSAKAARRSKIGFIEPNGEMIIRNG